MEAPPSLFHTKARQLIRRQLDLTEELQYEQLRLLRSPQLLVAVWVAAWFALAVLTGKILFA